MATETASSAEDRANPLLALKVRGFRLYWLALVTQVVKRHNGTLNAEMSYGSVVTMTVSDS